MMLIPMIILVAGGIGYMIFMKKRVEKAKAETNIDMNEERSKYDQYKQEILSDTYNFLEPTIGKPVDSFTKANKQLSTAQKVGKAAADKAKRDLIRGVTGVRVAQKLPDSYFAAMTGDELHILRYNDSSKLKEHIILGPERLSTAHLEDKGKTENGFIGAKFVSNEYFPTKYLLTIDVDGKPVKYELFDRIDPIAKSRADMMNPKLQMINRAKEHVVGERLIQDLQSKYPNLTTPVKSEALAEA